MHSTCLWIDDGLLLLSKVLSYAGMYCKKLKPSSGLRRSSRCTDNETSYMEHDVAREEEMSSNKDDRTEMKEET